MFIKVRLTKPKYKMNTFKDNIRENNRFRETHTINFICFAYIVIYIVSLLVFVINDANHTH